MSEDDFSQKNGAEHVSTAYLSSFRNFHVGDSARNEIFGHFLYDLVRGENHLKSPWGRLLFIVY